MKKTFLPALLVIFLMVTVSMALAETPPQIQNPYKIKKVTIQEMETRLFNLVNEERQKKGLSPLEYDKTAYEAARYHSMDMAKRDYFSHISPEGEDFIKRLEKFGFVFMNVTGAENLAKNRGVADPVAVALRGWLQSQGHYANIMNPEMQYGAIGVGLNIRGEYYFTQVFWGKLK